MLITLLFGLTRTVWIHAVIAEVYAFGLAILALLYLLALWRGYIHRRIYWLALVGGLGVFHHRALILAAPALIYAVWPELAADWRRLARVIPVCLLVGFLPYLYLPARAQAGADWVYGEPGTWQGFWDEFLGKEAEQYIGLPASWDGLLANTNLVNEILATDLTPPGIALGIAGLVVGLRDARYHRAATTFVITGAMAYGFHVVFYSDVLSALILPVTLSIAFGWLFLLDWLITAMRARTRHVVSLQRRSVLAIAFALTLGAWFVRENSGLIYQNQRFISDLTTDRTGLETIALARRTLPGATLMLAWGVRYHAAGFARDVLGELPGIGLVDHKGDFPVIVESGMLVTPEYTFYNHPVGWWEERLGTRVYLRAAAPYVVQIDAQPEMAERDGDSITVLRQDVYCDPDLIVLDVEWHTPVKPERDLAVFLHLLDTDGNRMAQGDQSAPVYGWRPLSSWDAGEVVRDVYPLPRLAGAATVRFGLYQQLESGAFENALEREARVECDE
jgi:hypothetical protein